VVRFCRVGVCVIMMGMGLETLFFFLFLPTAGEEGARRKSRWCCISTEKTAGRSERFFSCRRGCIGLGVLMKWCLDWDLSDRGVFPLSLFGVWLLFIAMKKTLLISLLPLYVSLVSL